MRLGVPERLYDSEQSPLYSSNCSRNGFAREIFRVRIVRFLRLQIFREQLDESLHE